MAKFCTNCGANFCCECGNQIPDLVKNISKYIFRSPNHITRISLKTAIQQLSEN